MVLKNILEGVQRCEDLELQADHHLSLYIPRNVFYIPTNYVDIHSENQSKFILFSAPGASGKSTLAKYLVDCYGGLYWDLSKIAIGENTFQGTLWRALRQDRLYSFWNNLAKGKGVLSLDAFDEAELISGRSGIEYFLSDVCAVTKNITLPTIFLFARTETSKYLAQYCIEHEIGYSMYEISFFAEEQAKEFVRQRYIRLGNNITSAVDECIDAQFDVIKNLLSTEDMSESFLGYAPVLEALSSSLDESKNTIRILAGIKEDTDASAKIIFRILKDLLKREQDKVVSALRERCYAKLNDFTQWENVYTENEQLVRIMEYVFFHQVEEDSIYSNDCIPVEAYDEYIEIVRVQLKQHPFLQNLNRNQGLDFAGPAFRDYTLACMMCSEYNDLANEYLKENGISSNRSSQLLFDFFRENNGVITDDNFNYIYNAFKAKEDINKKCEVNVLLEGDEGSVVFKLLTEKGILLDELEMQFLCSNTSFAITRLSNTTIVTDKDVVIGQRGLNAQISDSRIISERIIFSTRYLLITSTDDNKCVLVSKKDVVYNDFGIPQFDIRSVRGLEVCFPNINAFYRLRPYNVSYEEFSAKDFMRFYIFVVRVLGLISKHKQYVGKKDKEFIDNKIIGMNQFKRCLMDFLIDIGIIYKVHNELRWYELDVDCLAKYGLSQVNITLDNDQELKALYKNFLDSENYREYVRKYEV